MSGTSSHKTDTITNSTFPLNKNRTFIPFQNIFEAYFDVLTRHRHISSSSKVSAVFIRHICNINKYM